MSVLRATFAAQLRLVLQERNLSITDASKALEISRQALYNYLNEVSMPRAKILAKAMELWGLEIRVGQAVFDKTSFEKEAANTPIVVNKPPKQLDLWRQLDSIRDEDLQIGVKRVGKTLRVSVQIGIPA
jgi:transcriptional regulator with XRE-family HTH domain